MPHRPREVTGSNRRVKSFDANIPNTDPAFNQAITNPRASARSGGHGGVNQKQGFLGSPAKRTRRRQRQDKFRSNRPTNPHDPKSKDPFARAGMAMGTNDTKIFKRAGMNMGGL